MEQRMIQAAIVDHDRSRVVVRTDGSLPELAFHPSHGTDEGTLDEIGRDVFENVRYVSPDYRLGIDGKLHYQTKPVPESARLSDDYAWSEPVENPAVAEALDVARACAIASEDWKNGLAGVTQPVRIADKPAH